MGPERDSSSLEGLINMRDVRDRLIGLVSEGRPVGIEEVLQAMRESKEVYKTVAGGKFSGKAIELGNMISFVEEEIKEEEKREILVEEIFKAVGVERKRR